MSQPESYTAVLDAATITANRNGSVYAIVQNPGTFDNNAWDVTFELHVTALTGTNPTLDVVVEGTSEATFTSPVPLVTFTQATVSPNAQAPNQTGVLPPKVRARATIGGTTPNATYQVIVRSNRPFSLVAAS